MLRPRLVKASSTNFEIEQTHDDGDDSDVVVLLPSSRAVLFFAAGFRLLDAEPGEAVLVDLGPMEI